MSVYIVKKQNNTLGYYNRLNIAIDFIYSLYNIQLINDKDTVYIQKYKLNSCILLDEYTIDLTYVITKKNKINYNNYNNNNDKNVYNEIYEDDSDTITSNNSVSNNSVSSNSVSNKKSTKNKSTKNKSTKNKLTNKLITPPKNNSVTTDELNTEEYELQKRKMKEYLSAQTSLGQQKIAIVHDLNLLKEQQKKEIEDRDLYKTDNELYNKFKSLKASSTNFIIPFMFQEKYSVFEYLESKDMLDFDNFKQYYKPSQIKTSYDDLFMGNNNTKQVSKITITESTESTESTDDSFMGNNTKQVSETNVSSDNNTINYNNEIFINVSSDELYKATNQGRRRDSDFDSDIDILSSSESVDVVSSSQLSSESVDVISSSTSTPTQNSSNSS